MSTFSPAGYDFERLSKKKFLQQCPIAVTLRAVGGRWKMIIIWWLGQEARRFGELRRMLPGISHKVLTQQLRELEGEGLVVREPQADAQSSVLYSLTEVGKSLIPVLETMCRWGWKHRKRREAAAGSVA